VAANAGEFRRITPPEGSGKIDARGATRWHKGDDHSGERTDFGKLPRHESIRITGFSIGQNHKRFSDRRSTN
jgi:hypothetical protein